MVARTLQETLFFYRSQFLPLALWYLPIIVVVDVLFNANHISAENMSAEELEGQLPDILLSLMGNFMGSCFALSGLLWVIHRRACAEPAPWQKTLIHSANTFGLMILGCALALLICILIGGISATLIASITDNDALALMVVATLFVPMFTRLSLVPCYLSLEKMRPFSAIKASAQATADQFGHMLGSYCALLCLFVPAFAAAAQLQAQPDNPLWPVATSLLSAMATIGLIIASYRFYQLNTPTTAQDSAGES